MPLPKPPVPHPLRRLARAIDAYQDALGRGLSWLMLLMVAVVFGDVVLRYLIGRTWVFTQEAEWYLFGIVYLMAAGYTMLWNEHVRVDVLYSRWSARRKAATDLVLLIVMFFPSCLMIVITTWPFFRDSLAVLEGSPDPGGIPLRWALKSVIIIAFLNLMLQGLSQAIKSYYVARGWEEPEQRAVEVH